jgi:hypothetical protein
MRYLLLIYGNEQTAAVKSPEAQAAEMDAWWKYTADLEQSGQHVATDGLASDEALERWIRQGVKFVSSLASK